MPSYKFSDQATKDLENIIDFTLEHWGEAKAFDYIDDLEMLGERLAENPDIGTKCDIIRNGLLSFPCASHILYYTKYKNGIVIIRVLHNHMDPAQHFI